MASMLPSELMDIDMLRKPVPDGGTTMEVVCSVHAGAVVQPHVVAKRSFGSPTTTMEPTEVNAWPKRAEV